MVLLFGALICLVSLWQALSPFVFGYEIYATLASLGVALLALILAVLCIRKRSKQIFAFLGVATGVVLTILSIAQLAFTGVGISGIVMGIILCLLFLAMLPFMVDAKEAVFFNKGGSELAKVTKVRPKDEFIIAKAVLLGSMPETIYIKPGELCKMLALLDDKVFLSLIGFLFRGYQQNREQASERDKA